MEMPNRLRMQVAVANMDKKGWKLLSSNKNEAVYRKKDCEAHVSLFPAEVAFNKMEKRDAYALTVDDLVAFTDLVLAITASSDEPETIEKTFNYIFAKVKWEQRQTREAIWGKR